MKAMTAGIRIMRSPGCISEAWRGKDLKYMEKNVLEWLEASALKYPDKTVYEDMEESITFSGLLNEAKSAGSALAKMELSGKPVAVMMKRSVHTIAAFLGIVYSGHAYAPIDSTQPISRIKKILEVLSPDILITDEEKFSFGNDIRIVRYQDIRGQETDQAALDRIRFAMTETDPLYVIFTSGSSGTPKGVLTSHHSLMCYISDYTGVMEIDREDRLCSQSPLDYIAAVRDIYVPLLTGAATCLCPKEYFMQPGALFDLLNEKKISCIGWSTSALCVLSRLGAFKESRPECLKKVCFSGSVMPPAVIREWQEQLPDTAFVNQYGPTEATASCTYYKIEDKVSDEAIPIGVPYDHYRVFLLDEEGKEAEPGEYGEICVAGPILALGYYNDKKRTDEAFVQNPLNDSYNELIYKTGDTGRYREDGILEFHGRRDRQIKHMGHRVELDEIESAAYSSGKIEAVSAVYDVKNEVIWLFYSGEAETKELVTDLRGKIPGFMVPRRVKKLEELPRLANGKTDIKSLERMVNEA